MEYRGLGGTGLRVSTHCLGTMMFGAWGNAEVDECVRMLHAALDAGINFIDTADVYANGESEEIVGKALVGHRDDVILATKVHGGMGPGQNEWGNSRVWIMREVEESLRRLETDRIDLYQIHRPEQWTDVEETLGALTDLQRQGKIRYFGSSPDGRSSKHNGSPSAEGSLASARSNRPIRSSCGTSSSTSFPSRSATGWGCWSGAH